MIYVYMLKCVLQDLYHEKYEQAFSAMMLTILVAAAAEVTKIPGFTQRVVAWQPWIPYELQKINMYVCKYILYILCIHIYIHMYILHLYMYIYTYVYTDVYLYIHI